MKYKCLNLYLINIFVTTLIVIATNTTLISEEILFNSFQVQLSISRINELLDISKKLYIFAFIIIPLGIFLRVFFSGVFLYIGIFFTNLKIEFGKLFKTALLADFIYLLSAFVKLVILIFFKEVSTLEDLQFTPLSVMELLDSEHVDPLFIYPLSLLNVFELGYFLLLAWLLVGVINDANEEKTVTFGKSLKLVTTSYGSGLLLWVVLVMFITLNLS